MQQEHVRKNIPRRKLMIVEQVIMVLKISNESSSSSDFSVETIKKITKNERKNWAHSEKN